MSGCAGKLPDASRRAGACLHLAQAPGAGHQVLDQDPRSIWVEDPNPVGSENFLCLGFTPRLFKMQLFTFLYVMFFYSFVNQIIN